MLMAVISAFQEICLRCVPRAEYNETEVYSNLSADVDKATHDMATRLMPFSGSEQASTISMCCCTSAFFVPLVGMALAETCINVILRSRELETASQLENKPRGGKGRSGEI